MKEQHTTYKLSQCVPQEVQAPDVNQLVVKDVNTPVVVQVAIKPVREKDQRPPYISCTR